MTAALILAGGRSSRFGTDKTRATVDSSMLLERVLDASAGLVDEVLVLGDWAPPGVAHRLEPERHGGPLVAVAHGLQFIEEPDCLVLAADHPHLQPGLLRLLVARLRDDGGEATVPMTPTGPEPLVACYRPGAAAAAATDLVERGERRMRALLDALRVRWIAEDEWRQVDPDGVSFDDVDEPGDLVRARDRSGPQR